MEIHRDQEYVSVPWAFFLVFKGSFSHTVPLEIRG